MLSWGYGTLMEDEGFVRFKTGVTLEIFGRTSLGPERCLFIWRSNAKFRI